MYDSALGYTYKFFMYHWMVSPFELEILQSTEEIRHTISITLQAQTYWVKENLNCA